MEKNCKTCRWCGYGEFLKDGYYPCDLALWESPARSTEEFGYIISKDDDFIVDCDEWEPVEE